MDLLLALKDRIAPLKESEQPLETATECIQEMACYDRVHLLDNTCWVDDKNRRANGKRHKRAMKKQSVKKNMTVVLHSPDDAPGVTKMENFPNASLPETRNLSASEENSDQPTTS